MYFINVEALPSSFIPNGQKNGDRHEKMDSKMIYKFRFLKALLYKPFNCPKRYNFFEKILLSFLNNYNYYMIYLAFLFLNSSSISFSKNCLISSKSSFGYTYFPYPN